MKSPAKVVKNICLTKKNKKIMLKGRKIIKWRSTYAEPLSVFLKKSLKEHEIEVFHMLWNGYSISMKLLSSFFEIIRVGDGKYTLTVQKYVNETYSVMFEINPNYANNLGRFT